MAMANDGGGSQTVSELHQAIRKEFPRADADANGIHRIFFETRQVHWFYDGLLKLRRRLV